MNEEKAEYRNKQRSSFWWASLLWCLLLILTYYGVDIIEKGKELNTLTDYPIWGYVLWGVMAVVLWVLIIGPVIHFTNLRYVGEESLRRQVDRATDALSAYRREPEESELRQLSEEFTAAPRDFTTLEGKHGWQELLARFREAVHGRAHDTIIGYCKAAGVGMIFGFNGLLDGLILLAIQVRLVLELARVFGYKPTSFFNGCFFGWIAVNSLVVALTSGWVQALSASAVASMLGGTDVTDMATVRAGLEVVMAVLIQALIAGVLTYATGRIFLWRLEHEGREVALKTLLKLRVEGRREYAAKLLGASAALGLMEDDAQKPNTALSGRLLQLFGQRLGNKAAAATQAALTDSGASVSAGATASSARPAELPRSESCVSPVPASAGQEQEAPAPATPALEPASKVEVATPALESAQAAERRAESVEVALRGEGLSS